MLNPTKLSSGFVRLVSQALVEQIRTRARFRFNIIGYRKLILRLFAVPWKCNLILRRRHHKQRRVETGDPERVILEFFLAREKGSNGFACFVC